MASSSSKTLERRIKRADPSTIHEKCLVGYQGWFTCPGDGVPVGPGHHGWLHWFNFPIPDGGRPNIDLWPDVSSYSPSELYPAPGLKMKSGEQAFLFSSRNAKSVQRHFHWMAEHAVDGAFLQRFAGQTDLEAGNEGIRNIRDEVGDRVREAAEKEGRVFAIMYDVSGVPADRIARVLERDWAHLMRVKGVLDSPNYLKEKGKPVIALWGFGFDNAGHTPALIRSIVSYFRSATPGGVYLMAGVPAQWRTSEGDADRNPELVDVWLNDFDAISPWTIGRYSSEFEADNFAETKMKGDSELIKRRAEEGYKKVDYIPVVFPGGSGYNMSEGRWGWNNTQRNGGRFLWKQVYNARKFGVRTMYGAMWDEYDEGTAFMPVVTHKRLLPESDKFHFMALDEDGYDLPSDWYMRICGFAGEVLRNERRIFETFPSKELQDYWSSRPKYEDVPIQPAASGSSAGPSTGAVIGSSRADDAKTAGGPTGGQSYEEWLAAQNEDKEEAPPPPYSLEAEEAPVTAPAATAAAIASTAGASSTAPTSAPTVANPTPGPGPASVIPSSPSSYPPNERTSAYPGQQPHGSGPSSSNPVSCLANDFGRVYISPQAPSGPSQSTSHGVPSTSLSPPPLHPAHPAATPAAAGYGTYGKPNSNPSSRPTSPWGRPQPYVNMATRPSASQPPQTYSPAMRPQQPQPESNTSRPWSQGQWPPPEWGVNPGSTPGSPYPSYDSGGAQGGANLTRPHTYSAGGHSAPSTAGGANLRPSATISGGGPGLGASPLSSSQPASPGFPGGPGGGPGFPSGPGGFSGPGLSPYPGAGTSGYPGQRPASPYPPSGPVGGPGVSTYPGQHTSGYPGPQTSSYGQQTLPSGYPPPQSTGSGYPGQQGSGSTYPGPQTTGYLPPHPMQHSSPPHSPPAGNISYPSTTTDPSTGGPAGYHPAYQSSTHSGPGHAPPHNTSSPPPTNPGAHGMQFPQGPGGYGSSPMGGPTFPGGPQSGHGGYPPQNQYGQPGTPYNQHGGGPAFPQAGAGAGQAPWGSGGQPPAAPSRPNNSVSPSFPIASTTGQQALGYALSAVDKVAGKKTRDQLEAAGSKLFGKFGR